MFAGDSNDGSETHARPKREKSASTTHPAHGRWCHATRFLMETCVLGMSSTRSASLPRHEDSGAMTIESAGDHQANCAPANPRRERQPSASGMPAPVTERRTPPPRTRSGEGDDRRDARSDGRVTLEPA